jgi:uncharacterized protein YciI
MQRILEFCVPREMLRGLNLRKHGKPRAIGPVLLQGFRAHGPETRVIFAAALSSLLTPQAQLQFARERSMHTILFYDVVEDYVERRAQFRELHLKHARAAFDRGELLLGGALADPVDGAVLVFRGASSEAVEHFAQTDPYVVNGLVKQWRMRKWNTVIGEGACAV